MATKMSKQDLQWQAEGDARVMAQYQEIMSDSARKNRAIKEANKQAADLTKRANAMRSAASVKTNSSRGNKKR
jgi:hypothetical protein